MPKSLVELLREQREKQAAAAVKPSASEAKPASVPTPTDVVVEAMSIPTLGEADELTQALREAPSMGEEGANQFLSNLRGLAGLFDDPAAVASAIRSIMIEIANHPEYEQLMQPEDFGLMIRSIRESMGGAQIKKAENKRKKNGGKAAAKNVFTMEDLEGMEL